MQWRDTHSKKLIVVLVNIHTHSGFISKLIPYEIKIKSLLKETVGIFSMSLKKLSRPWHKKLNMADFKYGCVFRHCREFNNKSLQKAYFFLVHWL